MRWVAATLTLIAVALAVTAPELARTHNRAEAQEPRATARGEARSQILALPTWTHHVEIRVPFRDADGDGHNDYDPQFALRVTHAPGSNTLGHGKCSATIVRPRVGRSSELLATANERGLDSGCQLLTAFPDTIASGVPGVTLRRVAGSASQQTSIGRGDDTARATYSDGRTAFTPDIAFTGFTPEQAGTTFTVRYTFAPGAAERTGCRLHRDSNTDRWRIDEHGNAVRQRAARLVDTLPPDGLVCGYHFSWPRIDGFVTPTPSERLILASTARVVGDYRAEFFSDETTFRPEVILVAPFTDYDNDGAHDYAGRELTVTFARKRGEPSACSAGAEIRYKVSSRRLPAGILGTSGGSKFFPPRTNFYSVGPTPRLIDMPRNLDHHCAYDATFAPADTPARPSDGTRFVLTSDPRTDDDEITPRDRFVVATYENAAVRQPVTLEIRADPLASGETFTMTIDPVSGSDPSCDNRGTAALVAGADGTQTFEQSLISYERGHTSRADRCEYDVTWPDDEDGPASFHQRAGAATSRIDAAVFDDPDAVVSQSYGVVHPSFNTSVAIHLLAPARQDETFSIGVTPRAGSPPGCSSLSNVEVVVPATKQIGSTQLTLIHQPVGQTGVCDYDPVWPDTSEGTARWVRDRTLTHPRRLARGVRGVAQRYYVIFDAEVEVRTTQSVATDTTFTVGVSSRDSKCSTVPDATVTVAANASVGSVALPDLIGVPPAQLQQCRYDIDWPANEDGVAPFAWKEEGAHSPFTSTAFDWRSATVIHRYQPSDAVTFEPDVAVVVPQIDGPTPGVNLFAGAEFALTFSRAPNAHTSCSLGTPVTTSYVVQPDGSTQGTHPTSLVATVAGTSETCEYLFHVETAVPSPPDAEFAWTLNIDTVSAGLSELSPRAHAFYAVGDITFTPDVLIAAPQVTGEVDGVLTNLFADAPGRGDAHDVLRFDVGFAAPASPVGCTDTSGSTFSYEMRADGTVEGAAPSLLAYVTARAERNHLLVQVATPCVYGVTFPATDANKGWLAKSAQLSDDDEVAADDRSAMATYANVAVASPVDLTVNTPAFSGSRSVSITVSAGASAHAGCLVDARISGTDPSASATKSLELDASGNSVFADAFGLTDVVAGVTDGDGRCAYDVAWSVTDLPLATAIWTLGDGDAVFGNAGRVGSTGALSATYRTPAVEHFDATLNLIVVDHVPAGTTFMVDIAPASGAPPGCSAQTTRTLVAPALDGEHDRTIADTFQLRHTPSTVVGHCSYAVTWPENEASGMSFEPDAAFTPEITFSKDNPTVTNRYADAEVDINFVATLAASTTEAVTVGTVFVVGVAPVTGTGQPTGCSTTSEDVTVAAGNDTGSVTVSLIDRPAGEDATCSYVLSWARSETGGMAWAQDPAFTPETSLTAASPTAANRYAPDVSYFSPSLAFDVPQVDYDGDGRHDYAGATFFVTFTSTDAACGKAVRAYELNAAGDVEPVAPVRLIDEHAVSSCVYTVTFPPTSNASDAGSLLRQVADTDDEAVSGTDVDARATYREIVSRFTANLYLGGTHTLAGEDAVNPIPAGTPFTVTVAPQASAPASCDADPASAARTRTVIIRKAEVAERRPHTLLTVTRLAGVVDRTGSGEACVYDVEWPANEDGGTAFVIDTDPARPFSDTVRSGTADDVGAVVWYRARPGGSTPGGGTSGGGSTGGTSSGTGTGGTSGGSTGSSTPGTGGTGGGTSGGTGTGGDGGTPGGGGTSGGSSGGTGSGGGTSNGGTTPGDGGETPGDGTGAGTNGDDGTPGDGSPGDGTPGDGSSGVGTGGDAPTEESHRARVLPLLRDREPHNGWHLTGPRVAVLISLEVTGDEFAKGAAIELHISVPEVCGHDLDMFGGVPAATGLVYAHGLMEGTTGDITPGAVLTLPQYAERDDEQRDCEVNVALLTAPRACSLVGGRLIVAGDQPTDQNELSVVSFSPTQQPAEPADATDANPTEPDEPAFAFTGTASVVCGNPPAVSATDA